MLVNTYVLPTLVYLIYFEFVSYEVIVTTNYFCTVRLATEYLSVKVSYALFTIVLQIIIILYILFMLY
jgi:hypothetical protein